MPMHFGRSCDSQSLDWVILTRKQKKTLCTGKFPIHPIDRRRRSCKKIFTQMYSPLTRQQIFSVLTVCCFTVLVCITFGTLILCSLFFYTHRTIGRADFVPKSKPFHDVYCYWTVRWFRTQTIADRSYSWNDYWYSHLLVNINRVHPPKKMKQTFSRLSLISPLIASLFTFHSLLSFLFPSFLPLEAGPFKSS